jgi:nitrogen regulatory protein PII
MNTHPMKLLTIVVEALARERVTRILAEEGARGHTAFSVEGLGAKGSRVADIAEFTNLQIEVVLPAPASERILARMQAELLPHFAMIVYESDIRVLRKEKF